jgi:hypothetical protein
MVPILVTLVLLVIVGFGIGWFLRANPSAVARRVRVLLAVLGAIGIGGLLVFVMRFLPSYLPELFGLAGVVVTGLITRALRHRPSGGFSTPGSSQRTEVRTAFFEAWLDHGTGDMGGTVLSGRFASRPLDSLSDADLMELRGECSGEPDSLKVFEAYLDRRLGTDWRQRWQAPPSAPLGEMTKAEAFAVLGLAAGATDEEIRAAHRRLIQRVHPDVGGSADLAARINRAKDVLLRG